MAERGGSALPALALVFNAFVWGVSWWPFRALSERGVHPLWASVIVFMLSLAAIAVWQPGAWRAFREHAWLWALALACGMTNVGFNWGVTIGDVVRVVLLFYLMPAWSILLAWPLLGERPTPARLLRMLLALGGVAIVLQDGAGWPLPRSLPDWLALAGGASFALTNILLRKLAAVPPASRMWAMFGGGAATALAAAVVATAAGIAPAPPAVQWGWTTLVAGLAASFLLSNAALQFGAARLPAHATSLIMLSEVLFASLSAVALGAGSLSSRTLLGACLILAAAAWAAWPERDPAQAAAGAQ